MNEDRIQAIRLTDHKGILGKAGDVYELDFSRESVLFAEGRGFKIEDIAAFPVTNIANLFYYSFRKNHKNVAREKTDKFMEAWGGIPESVLKRLIDLYSQAMTTNNIQPDEEMGKNEVGTVEL